MLGLSLSDKSGQRKTIANLTQPIYIVLNNTEPLPPLKNFTAYCQLMRNIHRIDANVNSSIIVAYIQPMFKNFTGNFFIFANKGKLMSIFYLINYCFVFFSAFISEIQKPYYKYSNKYNL